MALDAAVLRRPKKAEEDEAKAAAAAGRPSFAPAFFQTHARMFISSLSARPDPDSVECGPPLAPILCKTQSSSSTEEKERSSDMQLRLGGA